MIHVPVMFDPEHLAAIAALQSVTPPPIDDWSDQSVAAARSHVKTHYIAEQSQRCCYCDQITHTTNHRVWDVEHVVPRKTHPQFTFTPENLAASCPDCNVEKGETQTLANPRRKTYPSTSGAFKIVHPHFDAYDDHIARVGSVYNGKTDKGTWTIKTCNLLRLAQREIDWASPITDERFELEVGRLLQGGPNAADALAVILAKLSQGSTGP